LPSNSIDLFFFGGISLFFSPCIRRI